MGRIHARNRWFIPSFRHVHLSADELVPLSYPDAGPKRTFARILIGVDGSSRTLSSCFRSPERQLCTRCLHENGRGTGARIGRVTPPTTVTAQKKIRSTPEPGSGGWCDDPSPTGANIRHGHTGRSG